MGLVGAILGDIALSKYEFHRATEEEWKYGELFTDGCKRTDDTIMSLATKMAIELNIPFKQAYSDMGNAYPDAGYGGMFWRWLRSKDKEPYGSFGNGSAMRVSYIADKFDNDKEVIYWATKSAECTHNHPEGIKGAVVTAMCSWMAKVGYSKEQIYTYMMNEYPKDKYDMSDREISSLMVGHTWRVDCQGSVPVAIRCFYESDSYESFLRKVLTMACDTDTLGAIGGCVAENFYKTTGFNNEELLSKYLDKHCLDLVRA